VRPCTTGEGIPVYKREGAERKTAHVRDCASIKHWSAQGYEAWMNNNWRIVLYQSATCRIIELLK
jgi:hypothetical protein